MVKIKGLIVGETGKGLNLEVVEDDNSQLIGKTIWFPKSQITLEEKEVNVSISNWLYDKKVKAEMAKEEESNDSD